MNLNNIILNKYAVFDDNTDQILFSENENSNLGSLVKRDLSYHDVKFDVEETVKTVILDEYIEKNNLEKIDFVKIDCEGIELKIFNGLNRNIKKIKCFQFEFGSANIDTNTNFKQFFDLFKKNDFTIYRITAFGNYVITKYNELNEFYMTTNYIALNNKVS